MHLTVSPARRMPDKQNGGLREAALKVRMTATKRKAAKASLLLGYTSFRQPAGHNREIFGCFRRLMHH